MFTDLSQSDGVTFDCSKTFKSAIQITGKLTYNDVLTILMQVKHCICIDTRTRLPALIAPLPSVSTSLQQTRRGTGTAAAPQALCDVTPHACDATDEPFWAHVKYLFKARNFRLKCSFDVPSL
jgi:hypothetical protein